MRDRRRHLFRFRLKRTKPAAQIAASTGSETIAAISDGFNFFPVSSGGASVDGVISVGEASV